jgi:hypothetical protein
MVVIQYYENNTLVLSQLVQNIPTVDESIKIKGRKGKVLNVNQIKDNLIHVHVSFEKVLKNQPAIKDNKKKKR